MLSKFKQVNLQERDILESPEVDGRTILECLKKYVSIRGTRMIRLRTGIIECDIEPPDLISLPDMLICLEDILPYPAVHGDMG